MRAAGKCSGDSPLGEHRQQITITPDKVVLKEILNRRNVIKVCLLEIVMTLRIQKGCVCVFNFPYEGTVLWKRIVKAAFLYKLFDSVIFPQLNYLEMSHTDTFFSFVWVPVCSFNCMFSSNKETSRFFFEIDKNEREVCLLFFQTEIMLRCQFTTYRTATEHIWSLIWSLCYSVSVV